MARSSGEQPLGVQVVVYDLVSPLPDPPEPPEPSPDGILVTDGPAFKSSLPPSSAPC
jgi:hypothetical protein